MLCMFQSLLPEKFHHLLCSYIPLGLSDDNTNRSALTGNNIDRCAHDMSDSSCRHCSSLSRSDGSAVDEETRVTAVEPVAALHVNADDLLHVVASQERSCNCVASAAAVDAHNVTVSCANGNVHDTSSALHTGRAGFEAKLRVNVETLTELELWQKDFAERSKTTMRHANASICTGMKTLYKVSNQCLIHVLFFYSALLSNYQVACKDDHQSQ